MKTSPHPHLKRLKFPCKLGAEKVAINAASSMAETMGFDAERIADIRFAIAEACTNAIEHGSSSHSDEEICITLHTDGDALDMRVTNPDAAVSPPKMVRTPDIHAMVTGKNKPGGMGLYLIDELMDVAEFIKTDDGTGYQFHMVIYRKDK